MVKKPKAKTQVKPMTETEKQYQELMKAAGANPGFIFQVDPYKIPSAYEEVPNTTSYGLPESALSE